MRYTGKQTSNKQNNSSSGDRECHRMRSDWLWGITSGCNKPSFSEEKITPERTSNSSVGHKTLHTGDVEVIWQCESFFNKLPTSQWMYMCSTPEEQHVLILDMTPSGRGFDDSAVVWMCVCLSWVACRCYLKDSFYCTTILISFRLSLFYCNKIPLPEQQQSQFCRSHRSLFCFFS